MSRNIKEEIEFTCSEGKTMISFLRNLMKEERGLARHADEVNSLRKELDVKISTLSDEGELSRLNVIYDKIFEKGKEIGKEYIEKGHYDELVTVKVYQFIGTRLFKMKLTDAWRGKMEKKSGFKKEEKEALNAIIFIMLLVHRQEIEGKPFNKSACIGYILHRILKKSYTWDAKPENKRRLREEICNYDFCEMRYVKKESVQEAGLLFITQIFEMAQRISDEEKQLFETAKAIVNQVEFKQIRDSIFLEEREDTRTQLLVEWKRRGADNYVTNDMESLFDRIGWGRNTVRWQGYAYVLDCNILAHMLETAVFGWLMALEENNLKKAEDAFFVGLFHDLPELWTDDIPSPCKDSIRDEKGHEIRDVTGKLEEEALEKYFYPHLRNEVAEYFRRNIIFESIGDEDFYKFMKKADYFSADYELWWNICMGSRELDFYKIIVQSATYHRTPETQKVLEYMRDSLAGINFLRP